MDRFGYRKLKSSIWRWGKMLNLVVCQFFTHIHRYQINTKHICNFPIQNEIKFPAAEHRNYIVPNANYTHLITWIWSEKCVANRSQSSTWGKIPKPIKFWCNSFPEHNVFNAIAISYQICDFSFSNFPFANMTNSNGFDLLECHSTLNRSENTYIPFRIDVNGECWQVEIKSMQFNDLTPAFVSITSQMYEVQGHGNCFWYRTTSNRFKASTSRFPYRLFSSLK